MENIKILYIREDKSLDDLVKKSLASIGEKLVCVFRDYDYLDRINLKTTKFKIIIVRGKIFDKIESENRFSSVRLSVIELCPEDEKGFKMLNGLIAEKIPENYFIEHPQAIFHIIQKNLLLVNKYTEDHILLKSLLNLIPNSVTLFDLEGRIIESNAHIYGKDSEFLKGKLVFDFIASENREQIRKYMHEAFTDKEKNSWNFESQLVRYDGKIIPVEVNATLIKDEEGRPLYFLGVLTDISIKKIAWEKEQFLSHLIQSSRDGIVALDRDLVITLWNQGAEDLLGFGAYEVVGLHLFDFAPGLRERFEDSILQLKEREYLDNIIIDTPKKDGSEIKLEISVSAMRDEKGSDLGFSATLRDVSDVHKNLDIIQKKNEEMEHMINVVSHDLRSPLHSIDNYLSFIQESVKEKIDDEDIFEMFERTHANLYNIENLIQDMTDFSRAGLNMGDEIAVDLNSLVEDIASNIQWQTGKDSFIVNIGKLPTIRVNPSKIQRLFQNLLNNAHKFKQPDKPVNVNIKSWTDNDWIYFTVQDDGIGIDSKHHEKIFNLFYRSKEKSVEGTGTGLAITKKIVTSYGGDIGVESEPGVGATLKFYLPVDMKMD